MKKIELITSALLFSSLLTVPINTYAETADKNVISVSDVNDQTNQISESDARKALKNYIIQNNLDQSEGEIILKDYFYDIDDTLIAYYFTIEGSGTTDNFYIVSAIDTLTPVIQYSEDSRFMSSYNRTDSDKAYYLGVDQVVFAKNPQKLKKQFDSRKNSMIDLMKEEKIKIKEEKEKRKNKKNLNKQNASQDSITQDEMELLELDTQIQEIDKMLNDVEASMLTPIDKNRQKNKQWDELLVDDNNTTENSYMAASAYYKELPVDRFYQRLSGVQGMASACGPTVGAMIMDYYHDARGFNIRDNAYYGGTADQSVARLINHLRSDMGTYSWGTTLTQWWTGALKHVRETASSNWYANPVVNVDSNSYQNSLKYRNAINNGHPVAIRWDFWNFDGVGLRYHFVTGIGWRKS